jgi:hypothetical protein
MFVRFRKLRNGGFPPSAASDGVAQRLCRRPYGRPCRGSCGAKPRCRWAINGDEGRQPYRIKVTLVENVRIGGKVKQQTICTLGNIDATWLDCFWEGFAPEELAALRCGDWRYFSLLQRRAFWRGVLDRMGKIGDNRLGADHRKAARRAIHRVVPWVMELEHKEIELLEEKRDFREAQRLHKWRQDEVLEKEQELAKLEKELPTLREKSAELAGIVLHTGSRIAGLHQSMIRDKAAK